MPCVRVRSKTLAVAAYFGVWAYEKAEGDRQHHCHGQNTVNLRRQTIRA